MRVKWLGLVLALLPFTINASQNDALPDIEFLEFLGSYTNEDQLWLELAMEEEQQQLNDSNSSSALVEDREHD